ncbi:MAG: NAD(P)H-binding protein [Burkholderiales bacterium]|nr:NAD(P)H-binding protein [Burkholderiales bacterium]
MKVLVCGAGGFIGRHVCSALEECGHTVVRGMRKAIAANELAIDFMSDLHAENWLPRLRGIDAVINAVGILDDGRHASFSAIHRDAPMALFDACERVGVKRVIQISALGGNAAGDLTPYMKTKREADAHLMASSLNWSILRPSLVVGLDGASSRFFRMLASLPLIGLPGKGDQSLQPVHIDDLCAAVVSLLKPNALSRQIIDVVGPQEMTYREMLSAYREAMCLRAPIWVPIPMSVMRVCARLAASLRLGVLSPDTLRMLEEHNVADSTTLANLLGRPPKGVSSWFAGVVPEMLRAQAIMAWTLPLLRIALAIVWITTAMMSLGVYPVDQSLDLLQAVGLRGESAMAALLGAGVLDAALGLATLAFPGRMLWRFQFGLIVFYTLVITLFLPQYWLHPFGPLLKNIPILAALAVLDSVESN